MFVGLFSYSQIGIGTDSVDARAVLDIQSTEKGILIPRMSTIERNALLDSLGSNDKGMLVYDSDLDQLLHFDPSINQWKIASSWVSEGQGNPMYTTTSGNVGIGTYNPTEKLHVNGRSKASSYVGNGMVPVGTIGIWSGAITTIPDGWQLCDGTNNTPDLRGRFVVGAGTRKLRGITDEGVASDWTVNRLFSMNTTGGADSIKYTTSKLPQHNHSYTVTLNTAGGHEHKHAVTALAGGSTLDDDNTVGMWLTGKSYLTESAGGHQHTYSGTTNATGSGSAFENRPAFYALAYIMRIQ